MKFEIIDFHTHIYPTKIGTKAVKAIGDFYDIEMSAGSGSSEELILRGKEIDVSRFVVCSAATLPAQVHAINDFIKAECDAHSEFVGFGTLHPYMEDIEAEVDRMIGMGLRGVKLHPDFQEFHIDEPRAIEMYRIIDGRLPVLFHMGDETRPYSHPKKLRNAIEAVPSLVAIGAHFGGYSAWDDAEHYLMDTDIYMDTSSALFKLDAERAADIIHAHGVDKFFFGTDYPMWDHADELARFMKMPLTDDERACIFSLNAKRFLGL